jgi:alkyldihydroxyacetonephosphate synthase
MDDSINPDCFELVDEVQRRQQEQLYVSTYHIAAASRLLNLDLSTVQTALSFLGCSFWPQQESSTLAIPVELSELCVVMLQCSPWLAPLFRSDRPDWSRWLHRLPSLGLDPGVATSPSVTALAESLGKFFDDADECCRKAIEQLNAKGFQEPKADHVLQIATKLGAHVPAILLRASISFHHSRTFRSKPIERGVDQPKAKLNQQRLDSDEALGFWGFHDSSFVASVDRKGTSFVTMRGDRYALGGKQMKKLLPFIEGETRIQVDPLNEAFGQVDAQKVVSPCQLDATDIDLLKIAVATISVSDEDRVRHGTGHALEDVFAVRAGHPVRAPDVVAWPTSEEEVEKILRLAKSKHWCIIPFGGGTNVSQATSCPSYEVEPRPIISVDMRKMNRVKWVNEEDGVACIEAGITGRDLVEEMARLGFTIGHEPDSFEFSTLGGWIATKASGMKRSKYGNIEDIVKGVRVAGSTGVLWHGRDETSVWGRESCGIDLPALIIGSEGCLGIITSAVVRIWPVPDVKDFDSVLLSDFEHGLQFVRDVFLLDRKSPSSCRLLDNEHFRLGQALQPDSDSWMVQLHKSSMKSFVNWKFAFDPMRVVCVTIGYEGSKDEVSEQKRAMARLCGMHGGIRLGPSVGRAGYEMTFMIAYLRDFAMTYHFLGESFETFAPWSKVEAIVHATKECIIKEHTARCLPGVPFVGCRVTQLYHEGVCLYFYLCMNFEKVGSASQVFSQIERAARSEILLHGGSLSHHHGIGKVRSSFLDEINSPALQGAMKSVKQGMDPDNIFAARNGAFASI